MSGGSLFRKKLVEDIIEKVRKLGLSHLCEYEKREQKLVRI